MTTVLVFKQTKTDGAITDEHEELCRIIKTFPISTVECERGFSALNDVCTKKRNRVCMTTFNAILFLNVSGPPLSLVEFGYVQLCVRGSKTTVQD